MARAAPLLTLAALLAASLLACRVAFAPRSSEDSGDLQAFVAGRPASRAASVFRRGVLQELKEMEAKKGLQDFAADGGDKYQPNTFKLEKDMVKESDDPGFLLLAYPIGVWVVFFTALALYNSVSSP